jgi:GNAT superfamily N-acetyltransferase
MSNQRIQTRVATVDDAVELTRMNAIFNESKDSAEQLAARMTDPRRMETAIIAEVDRKVVGFAAVHLVPSLFYSTPRAEVTEVFVDEAYRRQGVGRALMAHAERFAREGGAIDLIVLTEFDNHEAQGLYRARGFKNDGIEMVKIFADETDDG